jgi:peptidoglycan/xylan/chitin deacetylase (PgdA/CDA1 family)
MLARQVATQPAVSRFREIGPERTPEFLAAGYRQRHVFPHRVYHLPKAGPDGCKLAARMCGPCALEQLWEIVLYADETLLGEFPRELFFDDDVLWHRQQFGRPGQFAAVDVVLDGPRLYSMAHQSDLVQRISRRRTFKTRIEKRFDGWHHMLLNALFDFALEHGVPSVLTPTADLALEHTDPRRTVQRALFDRIYDRNVTELFPARREGGWWAIDVWEVRNRVVRSDRRTERASREKTICVCHDIERGLGHLDGDPGLADAGDDDYRRALTEMLAVEEEAGIVATYNVVGAILDEVRDEIEAAGHCIGFHSYDHDLAAPSAGQLERCRKIDYRLKGYRPPQSRIEPELTDELLAFHNFEWLASSARSLGAADPAMSRGLVRIPIAFDDFDLHRGWVAYDEWERRALEAIGEADFAAFGLHDCYARHWLPSYRRFLDRLRELGRLVTLDEVAGRVTLESAV